MYYLYEHMQWMEKRYERVSSMDKGVNLKIDENIKWLKCLHFLIYCLLTFPIQINMKSRRLATMHMWSWRSSFTMNYLNFHIGFLKNQTRLTKFYSDKWWDCLWDPPHTRMATYKLSKCRTDAFKLKRTPACPNFSF